jgi:hypothetical protein
MATKIMTIAVAACALAAGIAQARIGETLEQSEARYGQALDSENADGNPAYKFAKNGYTIRAVFDRQGKTWSIEYRKESGELMNDAQIRDLLSEESDGDKWFPQYHFTKEAATDPNEQWNNTDKFAQYFVNTGLLMISTNDYLAQGYQYDYNVQHLELSNGEPAVGFTSTLDGQRHHVSPEQYAQAQAEGVKLGRYLANRAAQGLPPTSLDESRVMVAGDGMKVFGRDVHYVKFYIDTAIETAWAEMKRIDALIAVRGNRQNNLDASAAMDRLQDAKGLPRVEGGVRTMSPTIPTIGPGRNLDARCQNQRTSS